MISIHALLAESDPGRAPLSRVIGISIHALLAESDLLSRYGAGCDQIFLSTLSLRRATAAFGQVVSAELYFYPRSPCGERRAWSASKLGGMSISIHALLAESDLHIFGGAGNNTIHFYPRSPCGERPVSETLVPRQYQFLSTLSLRRATKNRPRPSTRINDFYPRSPCGERRQSLQ